MTTLIASPEACNQYDPDWQVSPEGEQAIATALAEHMAEKFGGSWKAIPGGEANRDWNWLHAGNHFSLPTSEQVEEAERFCIHLLEDPQYWAPRPRWLQLDTEIEPGTLAIVDEDCDPLETLASVDYVTDDGGSPAQETFDAALAVATAAGWVRRSGAEWDGSGDPYAYILAVVRA